MTLVFDDASINDWNRAKVLERLTQVSVPPGVQPQIGTDWSLTGQIYWYTIRSTNPQYDLMDQRSIEDWTLYKQFKTVPNVVDVSDFGGIAREYQVRVDPTKLISYGLGIGSTGATAPNQQRQRWRQLHRDGLAADERPGHRSLPQLAGHREYGPDHKKWHRRFASRTSELSRWVPEFGWDTWPERLIVPMA